jgi:hypothetical protein
MLEAEGIAFQEKDGVCKIREEFFVTGACNPGDAMNSSSSGKRKKRKLTPQSSASEDTQKEKLKQEILDLLEKRSPGKTC